jgi:catalase
MHRQAIHHGRVSYEPNSLGGGCPFQAGAGAGFTTFPETIHEDKVRGKPEKFADHYTQATLFWNSQTVVEKAHIVRGFRFELTKVQVPAVRERTVSMLANVAPDLAAQVAEGLGIPVPPPMPKVIEPGKPEVLHSQALSLMARPGTRGPRGRKVAVLLAEGCESEEVAILHEGLTRAGAIPRLLAARLGKVPGGGVGDLEPDATLETMPSVLFDGVIVPAGASAALSLLGHAVEFVKDQYRHCKPILVMGPAGELLVKAGIRAPEEPAADFALILSTGRASDGLRPFLEALGRHRNWDRQLDPPQV